MFTGIIEELGRVRSIERRGEGARIVIEARTVTEGSRDGDSIAVNGVCLTALEVRKDSFAADGSRETLDRSTIGRLRPGSPVNLERAVTPSTRQTSHDMTVRSPAYQATGPALCCESEATRRCRLLPAVRSTLPAI